MSEEEKADSPLEDEQPIVTPEEEGAGEQPVIIVPEEEGIGENIDTTPSLEERKVKDNKKRSSIGARILKKFGWLLAILAGLSVAPVLIIVSIFHNSDQWSLNIPIKTLVSEPLPQQSKILANDGTLIATFYSENRIPVASGDIPTYAKQALVATEDARFYHHGGVDFIATAHALFGQLTGGNRGGSGITQQYVKNILITHAKTQMERDAASAVNIKRKIREAFLAIKVDAILSKEEILTGYFNTVFFGDGAYGLGAAAKHYFNKSSKDLSLSESALLVGMVQNPSGLNPSNHPKAAKARRAHVLHRMFISGYITKSQESQASGEPIKLDITTMANGCSVSPYPFYCQWIKDTLSNDPTYGATSELRQQFLYEGGLIIHTSLDSTIQSKTDATLKKIFSPDSQVATALAIIQPGTGKVVALSTNKKWGLGANQTELVLPVINNFQPGSTFKPITAITAIEAGVNPDIAFSVGRTFTPLNRNAPIGGFTNAESSEGGYYNMTQALAGSINTWFLTLEDKIGVKIIANTAVKMGMKSLPTNGVKAITERDASLTLGSYETSPLQVASVYATIAAHGLACNPVGILKIENAKGENVKVSSADCKQVIRASTADTVTQMMVKVVTSGTGVLAALKNRPVAGKTGTTTSAAAAWFAGFTPQYATAVWVGDPRGGYQYPLHNLKAFGKNWEPVWGGGVPATIWSTIMGDAVKNLSVEKFAPAGGDVYVGLAQLVPEVRGMNVGNATAILSSYGLTVVVDKLNDLKVNGFPSGSISATLPSAGSKLPLDKIIHIQVNS